MFFENERSSSQNNDKHSEDNSIEITREVQGDNTEPVDTQEEAAPSPENPVEKEEIPTPQEDSAVDDEQLTSSDPKEDDFSLADETFFCPLSYSGQEGDLIESEYSIDLDKGELVCTYSQSPILGGISYPGHGYIDGYNCPTDSDMESVSAEPHFIFDHKHLADNDSKVVCYYHLKCTNPEKSEWATPSECNAESP